MYPGLTVAETTGNQRRASILEIVGVWLHVWTAPRDVVIPPVPWRKLLLWGGAGMAISLGMVGLAFHNGWTGYGLLFFILLYIACFAASYGPVTWVVISEIFPIKMRGVAMSVATFALWIAVYLVTQLFPILLEGVGAAITFWIFFAMSVLGFFFTWTQVPETKGKTLEEIEQSW